MGEPFDGLPRNHFGAIYADPPWNFQCWDGNKRSPSRGGDKPGRRMTPYPTMSMEDLAALPIADLAAPDACLFVWVVWPSIPEALKIIEGWGFRYKTCAFSWTKADARQQEFFRDETDPFVGMGYWTRANNEACLLATRGKPKRLKADVRQAIVEPRRQHSRKPDCVYGRIERLVAGPYLELFSRTSRPGWTHWGNEVGKFRQSPDAENPVAV